jgi:hypothetical protein
LIAANATFALKADVWFRRALFVIFAPDMRQIMPLSGRKSTQRPAQFYEASSDKRFICQVRLGLLQTENSQAPILTHKPYNFSRT